MEDEKRIWIRGVAVMAKVLKVRSLGTVDIEVTSCKANAALIGLCFRVSGLELIP